MRLPFTFWRPRRKSFTNPRLGFVQGNARADPGLILVEIHSHHFALTHPEIPVRMTDPNNVEIILKTEEQLQVRPSNKFIKDDPIVNPFDTNLSSIAIVNQLPAALFDFGKANRSDAE